MKAIKSTALFVILCSIFVVGSAQWKPGSGMQMTLEPSAWPAVLEDLRSAHVDSGAYKVSKRTRAYDHEVRIGTPFARTAEYIQNRKDQTTPISFEEVNKHFDPSRLVLELKTAHRNPQVAESVLLVIKTDTETLQPFKDDLVLSMPKKIGFYAEQYQVVIRTFYFDLTQLKGTKSLTIGIIEADGKTLDVPVNLEKLR